MRTYDRYWELRLVNGDTIKADGPPETWERVKVPTSKDDGYWPIFNGLIITDVRNNKEIIVNEDMIVTLMEVSEDGDNIVGRTVDDEFIDGVKEVSSKILADIFGGGSKKNDPQIKEGEE